MIIWIELIFDPILGQCYSISSERHDGIIYKAGTIKEAVRAYEADKNVKVKEVRTW